ncbi:hypothetical protein [Mesorhizobium mediterraneum]|uniref:hypothetical protein n=1 Tax=Mesorhizobium mediterraneum TaxID=43617 RepID=UPI001AEE7289|nr:hypothetical protein [Mesorhizobium mediterraneum]
MGGHLPAPDYGAASPAAIGKPPPGRSAHGATTPEDKTMYGRHIRGARTAARLVAAITAAAISATAAAGGYEIAGGPAASSPGPGEPSLAEVKAATERFRDVKVALAEGYVRDPLNLCDTAEMMGYTAELGAMGIHFARFDLLGVSAPPNPRVDGNGIHTNFLKPSILIYEPQADGSLELVAVENLVFARAWKEAGHDAPPTFQGVPYDTMADDPATPADEAPLFEPHHDRHVWIYRENPNGVFAPFNPAVTCKHHRNGAEHPHQAQRRASHGRP